MAIVDLSTWLRQQCADYRFDIAGVYRKDSEQSEWPIIANDANTLESLLKQRGHLLPLPKEPAALANVLEVSVVDFLVARVHQLAGAQVTRGTERGYPDLELSGPAFGGGYHAIDVKAARRADNRTKTQSRITLYTGNTYFKHPDLRWPGVPRPFNEYASHLDLIMIYNLNVESQSRVEELELIVQEPWRIASKERSSTTREYIGAVMEIDKLWAGEGAFPTPASFYKYWRAFNFKVSLQVQKQYERALAEKMRELEAFKAAHQEK